ncbi:class C beta-lactamase-related serine hydrolase [Acutalibacter sp. 1XD8-33]|uniref:serine hydrolase domain-containing protein n=1 Tax=Acutalibacter sp. 1XD8-33 TaxID=2320081 RepID=UPI000EA169B1|nr:serine hydrolase [Acutalibacter sp. 1XD8-33]RKJ41378.1 class C beta-lactamase-related serine hydrolase [Acutalibacter sp. 1XD8-33]
MLDLSSFIETAGPLRALGVVVSQNGTQTARHTWEGACRRNVYSASKSFTSAAVGIALKEGLLSLDEKLTEAFPEELPEQVSENLQKATVRDLLTMCLGQPESFLMGDFRPYYPEHNWVKLALAQPFTDPPGTKFVYNNVGPYLAGILVQRRAGCDLVHYLMPRLFQPMDIQLPTWENDPQGLTFGAGGLFLTLDELHKFGLLYLQNGQWNGRQLVPESWVAESTKKQVDNGSYGYGYLFWGGPQGSFRADGKYGQFSILLRDKNAVVTIVAESRESEKLLAAVFQHIYPQL